jgi:hypothetical protein
METQETSQPGEVVFAWCLGSFHTAITMLIFVAVLFRSDVLGEALGNLETRLGLAAYGIFWLSTGYHTTKALKKVGMQRIATEPHSAWGGDLYTSFTVGGAFNGMTIWAVIGVPLAGLLISGALAERGISALPGLALLLAFGVPITTGFAFTVGATVGVLFAMIDDILIMTALHFIGDHEQPVSA